MCEQSPEGHLRPARNATAATPACGPVQACHATRMEGRSGFCGLNFRARRPGRATCVSAESAARFACAGTDPAEAIHPNSFAAANPGHNEENARSAQPREDQRDQPIEIFAGTSGIGSAASFLGTRFPSPGARLAAGMDRRPARSHCQARFNGSREPISIRPPSGRWWLVKWREITSWMSMSTGGARQTDSTCVARAHLRLNLC